MNKIWKNFLNTKEKIRFLKNLFFLSVLQFFELLLPFILIPYLIGVLGVEKFGLISFATIFITYFQIVIDFGFNTTATREISININNKLKIEEIYNSVLSAKIILLSISLITLILILISFEKFNSNFLIFILTFGVVFAQCFIPLWFFQGIQEVKYITYINIVTKSIFTFAIFMLVNKQEDYLLVPLFTSLGYFVSAIFSFFLIRWKFKIKFKFQKLDKIKLKLYNSKYMFLSELKTALITNTNVFVLGLISGNIAVGYFVGADKIIRAFSNLQTPILNALFPYLSERMQINKKETLILIKKIIKIGSVLISFVLIIVFFYSEFIIKFILKEQMTNSIIAFKILLLIPLASFLDVILGKHILLNLNKEKQFYKVLYTAAIINLPIVVALTYYFGYIGTAIAQMFIQIFIVLYMCFFVLKEFRTVKF